MGEIEATRILDGIYQGSMPPTGRTVAENKFNVLVLAAKEYQPSAKSFPGVSVIHAPLDDGILFEEDMRVALEAASKTAITRLHGAKVLITCQMGLNRSGLITALALVFLHGMSGSKAVDLVRSRRKGALFNPYFVKAIRSIPQATA
jgi:hypothetical protein